MDAKTLSELPIAFQILAGAGFFFGTLLLAIGGWFWNILKPKMFKSIAGASTSPVSEIPIHSAQILDHATFERLSNSIGDLIAFLKTKDDDTDRELQRGFDRLDKTMSDVLSELERTTKAINRLEQTVSNRTLV